jgi:hypothetical protein
MRRDENGYIQMNCIHGVPVRVNCEECDELARFRDDYKNDWEDELREAFGRIRQLEAALATAIEVFESCKAQWGDEYLWQKFGLDEEMAQVRAALAPVPGGMVKP